MNNSILPLIRCHPFVLWKSHRLLLLIQQTAQLTASQGRVCPRPVRLLSMAGANQSTPELD